MYEETSEGAMSSLAFLPSSSQMDICLYLGGDYRTLARLSRTCVQLYYVCSEEYLWKSVASQVLPEFEFQQYSQEHSRLLRVARNQAIAYYSAQRDHRRKEASRRGEVFMDDADWDPSFVIGEGGVNEMSALVPQFFRNVVRRYAQRNHTKQLRQFVETAMSCTEERDILAMVKRREHDLRQFINRVHEISFPSGCVGQMGARTFATSLQLLTCRPCMLQSIELNSQLVRDGGLLAIVNAIVASRDLLSSLERLSLRDNKLTDASAEILGKLLEQSCCRGGALRVLDVSDNPNLTEALLIHLATALKTAVAGDVPPSADWFTNSRSDDYVASLRHVKLESILLDGTNVGRVKSSSDKPPSSYPGNSAEGLGALTTLVQCFALLWRCRADMMKERITLQSKNKDRRWTGANGFCPLTLSLRDAGLLSKAVHFIIRTVESSDVIAPTDRQQLPKEALSGGVHIRLERRLVDASAATPTTPGTHNTFDLEKDVLQQNTGDTYETQNVSEGVMSLTFGPHMAWTLFVSAKPRNEKDAKQKEKSECCIM